MKEIVKAVNEVTEAINVAIDRCVPKIRARTLPHPEIDQETRYVMEEARGIKVQMVNGVDYANNRRRLTVMGERIRERWIENRNRMWRDLVNKTDKSSGRI